MAADLLPLVVSQLREVPLAAVLYSTIIAVVVFAAVVRAEDRSGGLAHDRRRRLLKP